MEVTAPVVEWNHEKGYGFLDASGGRVFLHIRDFSRTGRAPRIGDVIRYRMGTDAQGRSCAVDAERVEQRGIRPGSVLGLAVLLILPAMAVMASGLQPKTVAACFGAITVVTWCAYAHDKKRAESGWWRVSESTLHTMELAGGWPAAFLAQRYLRHKTSKKSFRTAFWMIVILHQFVAADSLLDWRMTRAGMTLLKNYAP